MKELMRRYLLIEEGLSTITDEELEQQINKCEEVFGEEAELVLKQYLGE